jgi:hypothetical protein
MTKVAVLKDEDIPKNDLGDTMDKLIPLINGSSLEEITAFFKFDKLDLDELYLFGDNSILRATRNGNHYYLKRQIRAAPPLGERLINASKAAGRLAKAIINNQPVLVSAEEKARRDGICLSCPHYQNGICVNITEPDGTIKKGCGCTLSVKATLATETCPQGKW